MYRRCDYNYIIIIIINKTGNKEKEISKEIENKNFIRTIPEISISLEVDQL